MIEAALEPSTTEEQPSPGPMFMVNTPAVNPFVTPGPVAFVKTDDHFDLEWTTEGVGLPAPDLAREFVTRSRRDVERHPDSSRALTNLGAALMAGGAIDEAVDTFEAALTLEPLHYPAMAHLARARFMRDELADAERLALRLRQHFPSDAVAPMMLGCIAVRRGCAEDAVRELGVAVDLDARSALPRYLLGMVLLGLHRGQEAIAYLRKATRLDDRSPALYRGLGVAYASCGDLIRAIRAFRTSLALDPRAPETVYALARVLMQRRDAEATVHLLASFVDRNPRDRVAQELLAQAYKEQQQYRAVKRHLQRALESLEGDSSHHAAAERARLTNNLGVACALSGAIDEAERHFKKALDADPHPIAFRNLFGIYSERHNRTAARRLLDRWLQLFPEDDHAALHSAVFFADSEPTRGAETLRRLTQSSSVGARAYSALGCLLSDVLHDGDAAITVLEAGYEEHPQDAVIANNLAYVYLMNGRPSDARRVLERVDRSVVADSVHLTATWGLLFLWEGDLANAQRFYAEASELARRKGQRQLAQDARQKMHLELARHYLRAGDTALAGAEVRKGLAIVGNTRYKDDLQALRGSLSDGHHPDRLELAGGSHEGDGEGR